MGREKALFDTELVSELARILHDTDLTEVEVEHGEMRIRLSREAAAQYVNHAPPAQYAAPTAPQPAPPSSGETAPAAPAASSGHAVPAPMVGTAYLAPGPDTEPFVSVGAKVTEGETLLIIEAMKVMNQIAAPQSGTVTQILVDDSEPVEFGQPLLVIE